VTYIFHRPPPGGSPSINRKLDMQHTPLSPAASISGRSSYRQICQDPDIPEGQPWVSAYSQAEGSQLYNAALIAPAAV